MKQTGVANGRNTMKALRLLSLTIALVLLGILAVAAVAEEQTLQTNGGCTPGEDYDPACDVNHDDYIDVHDIQLTAGHWGQDGDWTIDPHDHLGEIWVGTNNPLVISGTFSGWPDAHAPLVLNNPGGDGVLVDSAGDDGLQVDSAGGDGVYVNSAGGDGVAINSAGGMGLYVASSDDDGVRIDLSDGFGLRVVSSTLNAVQVDGATLNGLHVAAAGGDGIHVNRAGGSGLWVASATQDGAYVAVSAANGLRVGSAAHNGLWIESADMFGVRVESALQEGLYVGRAEDNGLRVDGAGQDGVHVTAADGYAGWFGGTIQVASCMGCTQLAFGVNADEREMVLGEAVAIQGIQSSPFQNTRILLKTKLAVNGEGVIGIVLGQARSEYLQGKGKPVQRLLPGSKPVKPGDYVTIMTYGFGQVKASAGKAPIAAGQRLTASETPGTACALRTVHLDGVELGESAPVIGIALEDLQEGEELIWALVNVR
jgi:hypothetical protein